MSLEMYVLDLESSGLSSSYHEVCEISIIRCKDRVQLTEFIKCDYPERANADALRITNKTLADLELGNSREYAVEKIDKFLEEDGSSPNGRVIIAHNGIFDRRMIHALYNKVNKKFKADLWACSMALTKLYAKKIGLVKPKVNLSAACDLLGIKKLSGAHASKIDSRNTYLLWKKLVEEKQMDYLPLIKTAEHIISGSQYDEDGYDKDIDRLILED